MKKLLLVFFALSLATTISAQVLVSYDKSDDTDFASYKTYKIYKLDIESSPEIEPREEGLNLLIEEISKQMNARGYRVAEDNPDLMINLGVSITSEVQTRETDIRDAPRYVGQRNYSWQSEEIIIGEYTEGTVTLDMIDQAKNEMIWQAVAQAVLSEKSSKNKKRITKGTQKLFKKYPIPAKK